MPKRNSKAGRKTIGTSTASKSYERFHWGLKHTGVKKLRAVKVTKNMKLVSLGELTEITYRTKKGNAYGYRGDNETVEYVHEFEKPLPLLCYDPKTKLLVIAGGKYKVKEAGITG